MIDNIENPLDHLDKEKNTDFSPLISDEIIEMTEDEIAEMAEVIEKFNKQINDRLLANDIEFRKLVKEDEEEIEEKITKIKPIKHKSIKITNLTYKQIKAHCKEHNISIEEWIERISLNEINRIITRMGDINYDVFKSLTLNKKKKKEEKKKLKKH